MDEYYATIFFGMAELTGAMICVFSVRYTGKRPLAFVSLIGCGICFLVTATYANIYISESPRSIDTFATDSHMSSQDSNNYLNRNTSIHWSDDDNKVGIVDFNFHDTIGRVTDSDNSEFHKLPFTFLLISALFAHAGIRLIPWMMIGEVFPTNVRSGASGIASGIGYFFAFLANKIFLGMVATMTLPGTFWFNSAFSLIGCGILYFVMPETEGKTLFEIEPYFTGKTSSIESNEIKIDEKKEDLALVSVQKEV